jgi:outer membrane protein assembly factor BamE (lipoprotein component of BamABCDE complex)|tara:strand:- start:26652 stop:27020 length:369 start_codon:yes stop_codon:yes gene_type:complete
MNRSVALTALVLCASLLGGCAQFESRRGVEVNWQSTVTEQLVNGQSTRREVLAMLGPPSQVIALDGESALYYLFEHSEGEGLILLVYNRMRIDTRYDRAIFFFDQDDVLTEFATRLYTTDEG